MKLLTDLLTVPGNGVYTVHAAREKKAKLFEAYYGTSNLEAVEKKWKKGLAKLGTRPFVFGVPSDNGGGIQRGANWGPLALRMELLSVKDAFTDLGDVRVIPHLLHDKYLNAETIKACQVALYGKANKLPVAPLSIAEAALDAVYAKHANARVLSLGGDHSVSYPLVRSWLKSRKSKKKAALLHFDAHTDLLDVRLGIDLCFGTWTYQILSELASPAHVLQLGIRSSGKDKKHWKQKLGVEQLWAKDIQTVGVEKTVKQIVAHYKKLKIQELYISFDVDALDQKYAGATGTPEPGGLTPSECAAIIGLVAKEFTVTGADVTELAPFVCPEGVTLADRNASISVAGDVAKLLLRALA